MDIKDQKQIPSKTDSHVERKLISPVSRRRVWQPWQSQRTGRGGAQG
jgi:hypothetical protein